MTKSAPWLLSIGVLLFVALLVSQDLASILAILSRAGWGLLIVTLFHFLPLVLDALAIRVLIKPGSIRRPYRDSLTARWLGESANSLMPGGQIGGPVLMTRYLSQRGLRMEEAAAAITVSTTLQTFAQILFALMGAALLAAQASRLSLDLDTAALIASAFLAVQVGGFYLIQRRGLFSKLMRAVKRLSGKRDWSHWISHAQAIDAEVEEAYRRNAAVTASFFLSLVGWVVGTGEVYLILLFLGMPVSWRDAFLLESLGQAIRGAGFAIPGALGVQEGGYLLLAPLAALGPDTALALSLAKRARELFLGVPGILYLHRVARGTAPAAGAAPP
ncbi:MAG: putative integral rane protein [Gammaproteobacteria bacterium]|jgi:putative membrane protein|nr:putative integral rane protein [Gammaproteobacteria bacterium]